jgi:hypothetical protein
MAPCGFTDEFSQIFKEKTTFEQSHPEMERKQTLCFLYSATSKRIIQEKTDLKDCLLTSLRVYM